MELQQLKQQLEKEMKGTIVHTDIWCLPMHTYEITYQPIEKKTMDILMKILLFSFQTSTFENAEELSDILLVEPLFIEDLMRKMQKNGLLARENKVYQLTEKGKQQFAQGVFEEELDPVTVELLYSPTHSNIFHGDIEKVLDYDDFPDQLYRYMKNEEETLNQEFFINEIQKMYLDSMDESEQEIKSILSLEKVQINDVPCIELIIWNNEKKEFFPRVWNTLLNNWDEFLEKEIFEKEKLEWFEKFQSEIK